MNIKFTEVNINNAFSFTTEIWFNNGETIHNRICFHLTANYYYLATLISECNHIWGCYSSIEHEYILYNTENDTIETITSVCSKQLEDEVEKNIKTLIDKAPYVHTMEMPPDTVLWEQLSAHQLYLNRIKNLNIILQ